MSAYVAQVEKDIRATWPLLALWLVGLLLFVAVSWEWFEPSRVLVSTWLSQDVLIILLTALLVLQEPLGTSDAFWVTKPVARLTLVAAKLTLIVVAVLLPVIVLQALSYTRLELENPGLSPVLMTTAVWVSCVVVLSWLVASLSRSLPIFVTIMVGLFLFGNLIIALSTALLQGSLAWLPKAGVAMGAVGIVVGLVAITCRYMSKRLAVFLPVAVIALFFLRNGVNQTFKIEPDAGHVEVEGAFALEPGTYSAGTITAVRPNQVDGRRGDMDYLSIAASLQVPTRGNYQPGTLSATMDLIYPDGKRFTGKPFFWNRAVDLREKGELLADDQTSIYPISQHSADDLLSISVGDLRQYGPLAGELTLRIGGNWIESKQVDVAAKTGESWSIDSGRTTIRQIRLEPERVVVVFEHLTIGTMNAPTNINPSQLIVYHPERKEILRFIGGGGGSGYGSGLPPLLFNRPQSQNDRYQVEIDRSRARSSHYPSDDAGNGYRYVVDIDRAWLAGARIRLKTTDRKAEINEEIRISDFRIDDWR